MKARLDYVTNSSSSSFIITNHSNEELTSEDVVRKLFEKVLEDAKDRFILSPGESISITCADHDGGEFENFIHEVFSGFCGFTPKSDAVTVEFEKSNHW